LYPSLPLLSISCAVLKSPSAEESRVSTIRLWQLDSIAACHLKARRQTTSRVDQITDGDAELDYTIRTRYRSRFAGAAHT
ncbi:unnamed protein product, partial [Mycena citricolor]